MKTKLDITRLAPASSELGATSARGEVSPRDSVAASAAARPRRRSDARDLLVDATQTKAPANLAASGPRGEVPPGKTFTRAQALTGRLSQAELAPLAGERRRLNDTQRAVLSAVSRDASTRSAAARAPAMALLRAQGFDERDYLRLVEYLQREAPITVNFDPTLRLPAGPGAAEREPRTVLDALLLDGRYRNRFETGASATGSPATVGGHRDEVERAIFGGLYHGHALVGAERPRYGALNAKHYLAGGASPYGSCYFVLAPEVRGRATLTPWDSSHSAPGQLGTFEHLEHVLLARLESEGSANIRDLVDVAAGRKDLCDCGTGQAYLEVQVHGPLELGKDVIGIVADARLEGTATAAALRRLAKRFDLQLAWQSERALVLEKAWTTPRRPAMSR